MESNIANNQIADEVEKKNKSLKRSLFLMNCALLAVGNCASPMVTRLYFLKGGKKVWLACALETGGWPVMLLPLFVSYWNRRKREGSNTKVFHITTHIFLASAVLGLLTGLDDFLYAYGVALLPLSTSALIIGSQLAFTAGFAHLLVKQKFTSFTINSIFLLTLGAVVLAFHTSSDRPAHESNRQYFLGFFMTVGASALYGFVLPAVELIYKKAKQNITYTLVMEMQIVMCFFATAFCVIGMLLHKDFMGMVKEANEFEIGKSKYIIVLVSCAVLWQFFFMGAIGVIFYGSSLLSGIIIAVLLPVTETLAVLLYHEKFHVEKALSLVLSLWGFISYFYGELKQSKKNNQTSELQTP